MIDREKGTWLQEQGKALPPSLLGRGEPGQELWDMGSGVGVDIPFVEPLLSQTLFLLFWQSPECSVG